MDGIINQKIKCFILERINIDTDKSGTRLSSFKSGGNIRLVVYPQTNAEVVKTIDILSDVNYHLIGAGTNTLIDDNGVDFVVCLKRLKGTYFDDNRLTLSAGESLSEWSYRTAKMGLSGLEFASGIPGSIGGAVTMNAGAYGGEIGNIIESVTVYKNGRIVRLPRNELPMTYRNCVLDGGIVTGCTLLLNYADRDTCLARIERFRQQRLSTQPRQPSLGSVFRKANGISAGLYIDRLGLKGCRIGGAEISKMHANFIVNISSATSNDYLQLMAIASKKVKDNFGIILEPEIKYIRD